jgi:hypothetical protein
MNDVNGPIREWLDNLRIGKQRTAFSRDRLRQPRIIACSEAAVSMQSRLIGQSAIAVQAPAFNRPVPQVRIRTCASRDQRNELELGGITTTFPPAGDIARVLTSPVAHWKRARPCSMSAAA